MRKLNWTSEQLEIVRAGILADRPQQMIGNEIGANPSQVSAIVVRMRREGKLPRIRARASPQPRSTETKPNPKPRPYNGRGMSQQAQGFYKWVSKSTEPLNGPLIEKIGKEKPGPNAKSFLECEGCMWPVGELFCGEPRDDGRQPYCSKHRKQGTQPYQPPKKIVDGAGMTLLKSLNQ